MDDFKLEEKRRIEAVHQFLQIDFDKSNDYQDIVDLIAETCEKPISLLTFVDEETSHIKVCVGTDVNNIAKENSFCFHAMQAGDLLVVDDLTKDNRFDNNPLVHTNPGFQFYAGVPLILSSGIKIGSLCVLDFKPSSLTPLQKRILTVLAKQTTHLMELEITHKLLKLQVEETEERNKSLQKIAFIQSHEVRHPLATIMGLVNLIKENYMTVNEDWINLLDQAANSLDKKIYSIVNETIADKDVRTIRFYKMIEEIEDYAIILLDREGNIENWNIGAEKIKGYKPIEIIGKNFSTFYTAEDLHNNRPQMLINQSIQNGFAKDEGWRLRKDGSTFWGSILITAIHDDKKNVIGFTKVTRDLTEKHLAEEANKAYIKQLESQIRTLSNSSARQA